MAGFGACGFHAARWEKAFRNCFDDVDLAQAAGVGAPPETFVAPLGPDVNAIVSEASSEESMQAVDAVTDVAAGRKLIVRVDRIELSKNILRGLVAYEELLVRYPQWREQVVLLTLAYASREGLADYLSYRSEIEHTAERINQSLGTESWQPIVLDVADNRSRSVAALTVYDVLLVNPVRDGLNLVAKEGPLVNHRRRRCGAVARSRGLGRTLRCSPRRQPVSTSPRRPTSCTRHFSWNRKRETNARSLLKQPSELARLLIGSTTKLRQ